MQRVTLADIAEMRARGYDRTTIAEAEGWLVKCHEADALIEMVRQAFSRVQLEDGIGLREACGLDDYAGPEELKRLRAMDEKHDWQRITAELLTQANAAPSFLDAQGMLFHTPAFIVAELSGEFHHDFIDRLIDGSYMARDFPRLLTTEQRKAIIACIRFYGSIPHFLYEPDRIASAVKRFREPE